MLLDVQLVEVFRSCEIFILEQEFPGSGARCIPSIHFATLFLFNEGYLQASKV